MKRFCVVILLAAFFTMGARAAEVETSLSSKQSNGEDITLNFTVKDTHDVQVVEAPQNSAEWQITGPLKSTSSQFSYTNGQTNSTTTTILRFIFHPLKKGNFNLPQVKISADSKTYSSPVATIQVHSLSGHSVAQNQPPRVPNFPMFPLENFFSDVNPRAAETPRKIDVFVDAQPSKTKVYVGQLIVLPFYIYANENVFRNLEFGSFPSFKDFIKEELYLPQTWRSERVMYRNEAYLRAEIIRFALFPLKEGTLYVDPLQMRLDIDDDMPGAGGGSGARQPVLKSSGTLPIEVMPLPPKPASVAQSEIPVGNYSINLSAPNEELSQNQPFDLKIKISGQGNIKGIPEPEIQLPDSIQRSKVSPHYEFHEDATGYKEFDFLLVPRNAGDLKIPENAWTYFDPEKKQYETLKMPSVELHVAASSQIAAPDKEVEAPNIIFTGTQEFVATQEKFPLWPWFLPFASFAFAGFIFVDRRREENELGLQKNQPWAIIERKIRALKTTQSAEALQLIEEWILCRFRPVSHNVASFSDLTAQLREEAHTALAAKIDKMEKTFRALEANRFGGSSKKINLDFSFDEIKKLSEEILANR